MIIIPNVPTGEAVMSDTITGTISGFSTPTAMSIYESTLYVVNSTGTSIGVVDMASDTVGTAIAITGSFNPRAIAATPSASFSTRAWVATSGSHGVIRWDNSFSQRFTPGEIEGTNMLFVPSNGFVYSTRPSASVIRKLNPQTENFQGNISGFSQSRSLAHAAGKLYVGRSDGAGNFTTAIDVLDLGTQSIVTSISFIYLEWITASATTVYASHRTAQGDPQISIIDTSTDTITKTLSIGNSGQYATFITVSPDGKKMYALYQSDNVVQSINLVTETVTKTITGFNSPRRAVFTADGMKAYVSNGGNGTISVLT